MYVLFSKDPLKNWVAEDVASKVNIYNCLSSKYKVQGRHMG